jgi:copper chaperone CopZ
MRHFLIILFISLVTVSAPAHAQWGKDLLNRTADKVNQKIDDKMGQGIDKVLSAPEKAAEKKREEKSGKRETSGRNEESTASSRSGGDVPSGGGSASLEGEGSQTVIQTNITCDAGRKKAEAALKKEEGVFDVKVNTKNGEMAVRYSSDGTSYSGLLDAITALGFDADGNKPKSGAPANPCKGGKK